MMFEPVERERSKVEVGFMGRVSSDCAAGASMTCSLGASSDSVGVARVPFARAK